MTGRTAIVLGASGLVGGFCLKQLLAHPQYERVITLLRRPLPLTHERLTCHVVDFHDASNWSGLMAGDDLFCCLGTTIKKAGSQEAFRFVDHDLPLQACTHAVEQGVKRAMVVTALGASPRSSIFYNRVKGEVEQAISALPFQSLAFFRPSLLLGDRQEVRVGEKVGEVLLRVTGFLMHGPLKKYRGIEAETVARAMISFAVDASPGRHIYESNQIQEAG